MQWEAKIERVGNQIWVTNEWWARYSEKYLDNSFCINHTYAKIRCLTGRFGPAYKRYIFNWLAYVVEEYHLWILFSNVKNSVKDKKKLMLSEKWVCVNLILPDFSYINNLTFVTRHLKHEFKVQIIKLRNKGVLIFTTLLPLWGKITLSWDMSHIIWLILYEKYKIRF